MKLPGYIRQWKQDHTRGFALVLVLAAVVLMSSLVVLLFSHARIAQSTAETEHSAFLARNLSDKAVNLVLAQLRTATEQEINHQPPTPQPWTSQPGGIRVYREDGRLDRLFKLYSDDRMVTTQPYELTDDAPKKWRSTLGRYVDLNEPRVVNDTITGEPGITFPIIDPRAYTNSSSTNCVEGFSYKMASAPEGTVGPMAGVFSQRLPMPVQWIYVFDDGSMGTMKQSGEMVSATGSTIDEKRRVVGRIAFWTDDETSKINFNTASEGAFWDQPFADTEQERLLATNQPLWHESQRHPGHPANVCLSSVLLPGRRFHPKGFVPETRPSQLPMQDMMSLDDYRGLLELGQQQDGISSGNTSMGGLWTPTINFYSGDTRPNLSSPQSPRYVSPEDAFIVQGNTPQTTSRRAAGILQKRPEVARRLVQSGGFLTSQSAAPELTLFGTPRVSLWPLHGSMRQSTGGANHEGPIKRLSSYDRLAGLCTTLGSQIYSVLRSSPGDGLVDFYKSSEGHNSQLFNYLNRLTSRPVPGFYRPGDGLVTFAEKYGATLGSDRDGILISALDYIRSANMGDGQLTEQTQFSTTCVGNAVEGFGQISPLALSETNTGVVRSRGLGRLLTISEIVIVISCRAEVDKNGKIRGSASNATNRRLLKSPGDREYEVSLLLEGFLPSQGYAGYFPYVSIALLGGTQADWPGVRGDYPVMQLNGKDLIPVGKTPQAISMTGAPKEWLAAGGSLGARCLTGQSITFRPIILSRDEQKSIQFTGTTGLKDTTHRFRLALYDHPTSGGGVNITTNDLAQIIPIDIPALDSGVDFPEDLPTLPAALSQGPYPFAERLNKSVHEATLLFQPEDIVQSIVPVHGDYRLMAAQRAPGDNTNAAAGRSLWCSHPLWGQSRHAHSLHESTPRAREQVLGITLVTPESSNLNSYGFIPNLQLSPAHTPDQPLRGQEATATVMLTAACQSISRSILEAVNSLRDDGLTRGSAEPHITGDFDTGLGSLPDGPYINKPDDGDLQAIKLNKTPYFPTTDVGHTLPPVSYDFFSAQRLIPSAVMLGSLPTGTHSNVPWQTLLFRPSPPEGHYGARKLPDHLLLDLFWQPVISPEVHSSNFETEGKVNLNHALLPFSHITRRTALVAALKSECLMAIPDTASQTYKNGSHPEHRFRHYIDPEATLAVWDQSHTTSRPGFITPSEITTLPLVPEGIKSAHGIDTYWQTHRLTGDNVKERPYAHILPKLTTQSNIYRVHYYAESIRVQPNRKSGQFDPARDIVTAQVRGSCLIRRQLQAQASNLPDYLDSRSHLPPLCRYYQWNITDARDFR